MGASYCVENVVAVDNQCVQYEYEYNNQPRVTGIDTQSRKNVLLHIGIGYINVWGIKCEGTARERLLVVGNEQLLENDTKQLNGSTYLERQRRHYRAVMRSIWYNNQR